MKLIKIDRDNMVNGPGVRVVLWVSGCSHRCKFCQNPQSWNPDNGEMFTGATLTDILNELFKDYVQGLTISGGDPFYPENRETVLQIVKGCKEAYPNKDIWCWTGGTWEDLKDEPAMKYIDVLVDGEFDYKQRKLDLQKQNHASLLAYRGSSNQRVIDVKKSLELGEIVLYVA